MSNMIRIHITFPNPEQVGVAGETVWAEKKSKNTAEVMNIPFFADDISLGDIIKIKKKNDMWEVVSIETKVSNHILVSYDKEGDAQKNYKALATYLNKHKVRIESAALGIASIAYPAIMDEDMITEILDDAPHLVEYALN